MIGKMSVASSFIRDTLLANNLQATSLCDPLSEEWTKARVVRKICGSQMCKGGIYYGLKKGATVQPKARLTHVKMLESLARREVDFL